MGKGSGAENGQRPGQNLSQRKQFLCLASLNLFSSFSSLVPLLCIKPSRWTNFCCPALSPFLHHDLPGLFPSRTNVPNVERGVFSILEVICSLRKLSPERKNCFQCRWGRGGDGGGKKQNAHPRRGHVPIIPPVTEELGWYLGISESSASIMKKSRGNGVEVTNFAARD